MAYITIAICIFKHGHMQQGSMLIGPCCVCACFNLHMGSKPGGAENNSDCNDENVKKNGMNHYNI